MTNTPQRRHLVIESSERELRRLLGASRRETAESLFRYLLEFEVVKAQRLQYCVSIVALGADLPPSDRSRLTGPPIVDAILRCLRTTDVVTPLPNAVFAAMLIDADTVALPAIIGRLREEVGALTAETLGQGLPRTTWSAGAACYPKTAMTGPELLERAVSLVALARGEGGDRFYVAS
jgi:hypothetical protein